MSFILDALKKSETDRQQRGSAEFSGVPTNPGQREGPPRWLWILGVLLFVNLAVLIGLLMRPAVEPAVQPDARSVAQPTEKATGPDTDFSDQVAVARQNAPPVETENVPAPPPAETQMQDIEPKPVRRGSVTVADRGSNPLALPTIHEVQANGAVSLPELHVDIHVYSESAEDRFVFINMNKVNEGSRLSEGPLVEEITPDGVVLSHNGTTFLLPRD